MRQILIRHLSWTVSAVILTPFIVTYFWTGLFSASFFYAIFPLFGLMAWSLLGAQYFVGTIRHFAPSSVSNDTLFMRMSSIVILVALLLHPLILIAQRYTDTATLPPASIVSYVGDARMYLIWIALTALIFFLLFDVLKPYRQRLRKLGIWRYVSLVQVIAMLLIFIHGLLLGSLFADGWMRLWWILLNSMLIPCYGVHIYQDFRKVTQK